MGEVISLARASVPSRDEIVVPLTNTIRQARAANCDSLAICPLRMRYTAWLSRRQSKLSLVLEFNADARVTRTTLVLDDRTSLRLRESTVRALKERFNWLYPDATDVLPTLQAWCEFLQLNQYRFTSDQWEYLCHDQDPYDWIETTH